MRRPAQYPPPSYEDPNDLRLAMVIRPAAAAEPRSVNLLGVPYDGAVLGRRGAAGGPNAIRQATLGFSTYNLELDSGLEDARIRDLGDVVLGSTGVEETHSVIRSEVLGTLKDDSLLVVLGGDNSISLPCLASCSEKFGDVGLIVVDSHLDLRGKIGGRPTSGSSYGLAIEDGLVRPKNVAEVGMHGFLNSRAYVDRAKKTGIRLFSAEDVGRMGPRAVAREALRVASKGTRAVYLSFDLDAVDLAQASGVSAPSAGGMWARNAFVLVYEIAKEAKVKCADIVELAPALDPAGSSQRVAAAALAYLIAGYHARGKKESRAHSRR